MTTLVTFLEEYFFVYLWLIITTFINIVAPTSGSTIINPVTAFFTDPQRAIGIAGFLFFFTGLHRVYLFRKEILSDTKNIKMIKTMLPYSMLGAVLGGTIISYLNARALAFAIVIVSLYFIYKTVIHIIYGTQEKNRHTTLGVALIGTMSGFFQGSGMPGSDIRNNYMRITLSEVAVRAVGSAIGLVNFFIAGSIIFLHNRLTHRDIIFIISIIPFLLLAQIYGKKYLDKMSDRNAKILAVCLSLLGVILLTYKYLL